MFDARTTLAILALIVGCGGSDKPGPTSMGGVLGAGMGAAPSGGSGGLGSAGLSAAGSGGGSGGPSVAGAGGASTSNTAGGSGGPSVAGAGASPGGRGGGSGGQSTAAGGGAGSTAGTSGGGSAIPATFETVKLVLGGGGGIMPCSAAPCHGVGGMAPPAKPLELPPMNDAQLYMNLTSYVSKACNNTKLVTPGNPAQSALLTILKGPCGMTPRMPYGCSADAGDCIPDDYIAAVAQWITNGAPQR